MTTRHIGQASNNRGRQALPVLILLLLGYCVVVVLTLAAGRGQDRIAAERSFELMQALLTARERDLGRINKDYAWWDDAVANLVTVPDATWASHNIGTNVYATFRLSSAMVVTADDTVTFAFAHGEPLGSSPPAALSPALRALVEFARAAPAAEPVPATGFVGVDGVVHLAAATAITPFEQPMDAAGAPRRHVLVFTNALDGEYLSAIAMDYGFTDLAQAAGDNVDRRTELPLRSADGITVGKLIWKPARPGDAMYWMLLPPVAIAFMVMALLAFIIVRQIERGRLANERNLGTIAAKNAELERLAVLQNATWEAIGEGIAVFDRGLRLASWNRNFIEMNSYPDSLVRTGTPLAALLRHEITRGDHGPAGDGSTVTDRLLAAPGRGETPVELPRPAGRVLELRRSPMHDGGFVCSYRDITERKRAELELVSARDQAELANRSKTEFLANVSHELRTPLNAILGFSEIMQVEMFGPLGASAYRDYARDIHQSGSLLLDLINDILDLSKIEAGKFDLHEEPVDLIELFAAVLRIVRERARSAGLVIDMDIPSDLPLIRADKRALKQILLNLLSNAVKFTPNGGRITLSATAAADGSVRFSVRDTGIGIAADDIPRAMATFGQVDSRFARKFSGTGLGLPLSRALAELHRASFSLESEPGVGTTVTVSLPSDRVAA